MPPDSPAFNSSSTSGARRSPPRTPSLSTPPSATARSWGGEQCPVKIQRCSKTLPSDIKRRNAMIAKVKDSPPAPLTRKPGSHRSPDDRKVSGGEAQPSSTLAVDATPQAIDITYDPTAPPSSQFTFNNNSNSLLKGKRYLPVAQQSTPITLGLKTQNG